MITPRPRLTIEGRIRLQSRNGARMLVAITRSKSATEVSCAVDALGPPVVPALLIRTSTAPSLASVSDTQASTSAASPTSPTIVTSPREPPPAACRGCRRLDRTRRHGRRPAQIAGRGPRPMPDAAPVTRTTQLIKSCSCRWPARSRESWMKWLGLRNSSSMSPSWSIVRPCLTRTLRYWNPSLAP